MTVSTLLRPTVEAVSAEAGAVSTGAVSTSTATADTASVHAATAHTASAAVPQDNAPGARPLAALVGADLTVPLISGASAPYVNLDYAASAPAALAVAEQVAAALPYYASVHRGAGYASQVSTALVENARVCVARFVDARPDEDVVVFTRNTTDALNLLAHAVPPHGSVLYLDLEHHANLLPWQRRGDVVLEAAPTLAETLADLDAALAATPTALVTVTGASNVTGELTPVAEIARIAHRHGARLAVDAAQLAPHRRVSLLQTGIDYLAFSGHKLYAPYGAGVLVGRRDWLDAAPAYLAGGGAVREVGVEATAWAAAPARHEAGTPNVLGIAAIAKACETLSVLGETVSAHEEALRTRLLDGLAALDADLGGDAVRVLRIWSDSADAIGVVSFAVAGYDAGLVAAYLSAEHGIGVRDGRFCAHPLLARLGLGRDGAVRASFGLGSTLADVDRLLGALRTLLADGPSAEYELVDGRYAPKGDPRPLPDFAGPATYAGAPCSTEDAASLFTAGSSAR